MTNPGQIHHDGARVPALVASAQLSSAEATILHGFRVLPLSKNANGPGDLSVHDSKLARDFVSCFG